MVNFSFQSIYHAQQTPQECVRVCRDCAQHTRKSTPIQQQRQKQETENKDCDEYFQCLSITCYCGAAFFTGNGAQVLARAHTQTYVVQLQVRSTRTPAALQPSVKFRSVHAGRLPQHKCSWTRLPLSPIVAAFYIVTAVSAGSGYSLQWPLYTGSSQGYLSVTAGNGLAGSSNAQKEMCCAVFYCRSLFCL